MSPPADLARPDSVSWFPTRPDGMMAIVGDALHHARDMAFVLRSDDTRWSDALVSETRAHLSGCLDAIGGAIAGALGEDWLARPVAVLGVGYCGNAVEARPVVVSVHTLHHLRRRACAALVLRGATARRARFEPRGSVSPATFPPAVARGLADLRRVTEDWLSPHPAGLPMPASLPIEPYADLAWSAAALFVEGLGAEMGVAPASSAGPIGRAAAAVIAGHDEGTGPFARAAYVAAIADPATLIALAGEAVATRDLLLLAAAAGRRAGMDPEPALAILVGHRGQERAALGRLAGLDDDAYSILLDMLSPIVGEGAAAGLVSDLTAFRTMEVDQAREALALRIGADGLAAKLARLGIGE